MCTNEYGDLLIIGNGFDLYHQLPTRYNDFLFLAGHWTEFISSYNSEWPASAPCSADRMQIRRSGKGELTLESLEDYANYRNILSKERIAFLNENLPRNKWIDYFLRLEIPGKGWIDFENEIKKALEAVEDYFVNLPNRVDEVGDGENSFIQRILDIFSPVDNLEYNDLTERFVGINDVERNNLSRKKSLFLDEMKKALDNLNTCLNYYLQEFVERLPCNVYSEQIKSLSDVYLLNFNYTHTLERIYDKDIKLLGVHSIHGDAIAGNMVLGIEDTAFESTLDYVYFQKYFQRIQKKTGNYFKSWNFRNVYIMGHSLSKVDFGIFKEIFCEMDCEQIIIFYYDQQAYEQIIINLIEMFEKDFVIENVSDEKIVFEHLKPGRLLKEVVCKTTT